MYPANRRDVEEAVALVRELAPADRNGIELIALAARLKVPPEHVESLTRRYPEYFVRVGNDSR